MLLASVTPVALAVAGWDVPPRQALELGIQGGLVLLHIERLTAEGIDVARGEFVGDERSRCGPAGGLAACAQAGRNAQDIRQVTRASAADPAGQTQSAAALARRVRVPNR